MIVSRTNGESPHLAGVEDEFDFAPGTVLVYGEALQRYAFGVAGGAYGAIHQCAELLVAVIAHLVGSFEACFDDGAVFAEDDLDTCYQCILVCRSALIIPTGHDLFANEVLHRL